MCSRILERERNAGADSKILIDRLTHTSERALSFLPSFLPSQNTSTTTTALQEEGVTTKSSHSNKLSGGAIGGIVAAGGALLVLLVALLAKKSRQQVPEPSASPKSPESEMEEEATDSDSGSAN